MIISTIISIIVAIVIYNDAQTRGIDPTGYILLTCCCSWCIGGIVYLIVRSNNPPRGNIGGPQPGFSSNAGFGQGESSMYGRPDGDSGNNAPSSSGPASTTYRPQPTIGLTKICSMCGSENPIDARFCSNCGSNSFN